MATGHSIAYLNGTFVPLQQVSISPLDRGFLFADGVYEVIPVYNGRPFRLAHHLQRLSDSLAGLRLEAGIAGAGWEEILDGLVTRNGRGQLSVYLQVTRGAPETRDHHFPAATRPTVFAMATPLKPMPRAVERQGLAAVTGPDIRWGACHLKTIGLLANVLARQQAVDRGATDTILIRAGYLTEGSASNLFLARDGILLTPRKDHRILPGITRDLILELAAADGIDYREDDLPASALETADEVWLTSSTKEIMPITRVDDRPVGAGLPGPLWRRMMGLYQDYKQQVCPPAPARA